MLKAFQVRLGTKKWCLLSPLLFNIVLEVLATAIQKRKINKMHLNWKESSKTITVWRWHDPYIEDPRDTTKKLLELINEFSKL